MDGLSLQRGGEEEASSDALTERRRREREHVRSANPCIFSNITNYHLKK